MDTFKTRLVEVVCSDGLLRQFPLADRDRRAAELRSRLGRASLQLDATPSVREVAEALDEVERAWRGAVAGARAVWRGRRPAAKIRDLVARRLHGDEQAADVLFTEALFVAR